MNFNEIKEEFKKCPKKDILKLIDKYKDDTRKNVKNIIISYENKIKKYNKELVRLQEITSFERELYDKNITLIAGIDEVGRGPLAGPVVSAAVIMPKGCKILYVDDSKKLSESKRNEIFEKIKEKAIAIGVGMVEPDEIDKINILNSTKKSMIQAVKSLEVKPEYLLIDAITLDRNIIDIKQNNIIKGDERSHSIACASIIAKVTRDKIMVEYDEKYKGYNFKKNKGYGTREHLDGIEKLGICEIHRKSFLKSYL